jgi:hypothetical protein
MSPEQNDDPKRESMRDLARAAGLVDDKVTR